MVWSDSVPLIKNVPNGISHATFRRKFAVPSGISHTFASNYCQSLLPSDNLRHVYSRRGSSDTKKIPLNDHLWQLGDEHCVIERVLYAPIMLHENTHECKSDAENIKTESNFQPMDSVERKFAKIAHFP